jgi:hypothetical protein
MGAVGLPDSPTAPIFKRVANSGGVMQLIRKFEAVFISPSH